MVDSSASSCAIGHRAVALASPRLPLELPTPHKLIRAPSSPNACEAGVLAMPASCLRPSRERARPRSLRATRRPGTLEEKSEHLDK